MADLSQLMDDLNSRESATRAGAARQLAQQGEAARPAALGLLRNLADPEESVVEWSTAALEGLGTPAVEDLGAIIELTGNPNSDVRYWAVTLLGRLRGAAEPAVPALVAALRQPSELHVRERAAWALGRIGPAAAAARPALDEATRSHEPRLARLAERALQEIGPAS